MLLQECGYFIATWIFTIKLRWLSYSKLEKLEIFHLYHTISENVDTFTVMKRKSLVLWLIVNCILQTFPLVLNSKLKLTFKTCGVSEICIYPVFN